MTKDKFLALERMFKSNNIQDHILGWELVEQDESITGIHLRYLYILCNIHEGFVSMIVQQAYNETSDLCKGGITVEFSLEKFPLDD